MQFYMISVRNVIFVVVVNIFKDVKAREGQERNYTTATMLKNRLKIGSIMESKVLLKTFQISPNGLLPNNEPIITLLLNTDMLILVGRVYKNFTQPYIPVIKT